jgi:hypothetical protein
MSHCQVQGTEIEVISYAVFSANEASYSVSSHVHDNWYIRKILM